MNFITVWILSNVRVLALVVLPFLFSVVVVVVESIDDMVTLFLLLFASMSGPPPVWDEIIIFKF